MPSFYVRISGMRLPGNSPRSFLFFCFWSALTVGESVGQEAPEPRKPLKVSMQIMAARLLTTVTPQSPAMPKCFDRMVTLDVVVREDGTVASIKVIGGLEEFRESAIEAVRQWTYKPYMEDEKPTAVETTVLVFYPNVGPAGSLFVPDGKGGSKGGKFLPLPSECGPPIQIKKAQ